MTNRTVPDIYAPHTSDVVLARTLDGSWSIHAPGTTCDQAARGENVLLSGTAERQADGSWDAPTVHEYVHARAKLRAVASAP